jgi:hypothetical protein
MFSYLDNAGVPVGHSVTCSVYESVFMKLDGNKVMPRT